MAGRGDPERNLQVLNRIIRFLGMRSSDVARSQISFVGTTDHWMARIDYTPGGFSKAGGYQLFEGNLCADSVESVSAVLGKGRATPMVPITPTQPVRSNEEILDERYDRRVRNWFSPTIDQDRD